MTRLQDVTTNIRSKNAGPFYVTFDIFFNSDENFERFSEAESLQPPALASRLGTSADTIRRFSVPSLNVVKFSIPRASPQGGVVERDMHCGQMYVSLLDLPLDG